MKVLSAILLELILGTCASVNEPDVSELGFVTKIKNNQEIEFEIISTPSDTDMFYINFELLVLYSEIEKYPKSYNAFHKALNEWSQQIPVRWIIFKMPDSYKDKKLKLTTVRFVDMDDPQFGDVSKFVGIWQFYKTRILFDAVVLEENPHEAYIVSLHELGHMLGVPHIMSFDSIDGYTGFLVLPEGVDPATFVMFPKSMEGKNKQNLSPMEIELARYHLIHYWTRPDVMAQYEN